MYKVIKEHSGTKIDTRIAYNPRPDLEKYMVYNGYWEKIEPEVKSRKKKVVKPKENK
jgi:hypothetical protein